ncbi:MAG: nuclear transport factor 2 family protein [Pyrinomonadaceae bacterium]
MNEQENTRIVQQCYKLFKSGDIQALLDLFSEDIDFQMPEIENVPFSGRHWGREATARFFKLVSESQDVLEFDPQEFIAQGDKVVVLGNSLYRVKSSGHEYGGEWVHVWTVRGGKILASKEYLDTAASSAAYQQAARA